MFFFNRIHIFVKNVAIYNSLIVNLEFIMRFNLVLEVNKHAFGNMLPINYQYEQSAAIYRILSSADEAYASWLHDNGSRLENGKTFIF